MGLQLRDTDRARSTLQYKMDQAHLTFSERAVADGYFTVFDRQTSRREKISLSVEERDNHSRLCDALRAKLARLDLYLPARGMSESELFAFAKKNHEPELPLGSGHAAIATKKITEHNWSGYLDLFGSHERMFPFLTIHAKLTEKEYWQTLSSVWINSEWAQEFGRIWSWLFFENRDRSGANGMMNAKERKRWNKLPNEFRVYRGQQQIETPSGFSWTLSRERAVTFASKYRPRFTEQWKRGPGVVLSGIVAKSDVLAYLNDRAEEEVLIPVRKVRVDRYDQP